MDFTPEQQEIIKKRRDALTAIYGAEMDAVTDADILAYTNDVFEQMLKKTEPQPITKADMEALYGVIERQGKALDAFAKKIEAQDQAIGAVNQNIEQVAQAVTPLMQAFAEFNKADAGAAAPPGAVVHHNGNGGGKVDIMSLLGNPLVQKFLGAGGEQANPLQAVLGQVQFVADLREALNRIGGGGGGAPNAPKNNNWDRRDFIEGARWGYRIKTGDLPSGLLKALSGDDDDDGKAPRIIVVEQPADAVRNRRESDGEHKI